jgi:hypothetical protein
LKARSGYPLELDGFNKQIGIAFEHQGRQHYFREKRFFHKKHGQFENQIRRDRRKAYLCRQHGISLVKIPEVGWKFSLQELLPEVINRCRRLGIQVPAGAKHLEINYAQAWNMNQISSAHYFRKLKNYIKRKGGSLIDSEWHGASLWKYQVKCRKGHVFKSVFGSLVNQGTWCPSCKKAILSIKVKKRWAGSKGMRWRKASRESGQKWIKKLHVYCNRKDGECLNTEWQGWNHKYSFLCKKCGKRWKAKPYHLLKEQAWCRSCSARKMHVKHQKNSDHLATIQKYAISKGGKCFSKSWKGWAHKYSFGCGECGRRWSSRGGTILNGSWCKPCAQRKWLREKRKSRDYLGELQSFAKSKGGKCLAKEWCGWSKRYRFRCKCGREWDALGGNILHLKNWCRPCSMREAGSKRNKSNRKNRLPAMS